MIGGDDLTIGGYWGPRPESVEDCAARVLDFMSQIALLGPPFSTLKWSRERPRELKVPFAPDRGEISRRLMAGRNRRDMDRGVIEDLGFVVSLDEGLNSYLQARVWFHCGAWTTSNPNSVVVDPPVVGNDLPISWPADVIRAIVDSFDPDWARVDFASRMEASLTHVAGRPSVGWMLYLKGIDRLPSLPDPAQMELCGNGVLITAVDGTYDPANRYHQTVSDEIEARLRRVGLLRTSAVGAGIRPSSPPTSS